MSKLNNKHTLKNLAAAALAFAIAAGAASVSAAPSDVFRVEGETFTAAVLFDCDSNVAAMEAYFSNEKDARKAVCELQARRGASSMTVRTGSSATSIRDNGDRFTLAKVADGRWYVSWEAGSAR